MVPGEPSYFARCVSLSGRTETPLARSAAKADGLYQLMHLAASISIAMRPAMVLDGLADRFSATSCPGARSPTLQLPRDCRGRRRGVAAQGRSSCDASSRHVDPANFDKQNPLVVRLLGRGGRSMAVGRTNIVNVAILIIAGHSKGQVDRAAQIIGVSSPTVYRWLRTGNDGQSAQRGGRRC
jgi:hypothetical protein